MNALNWFWLIHKLTSIMRASVHWVTWWYSWSVLSNTTPFCWIMEMRFSAWLSVIFELSSEKHWKTTREVQYSKFGFLDRVTESPPENAIFLVPFHLEPIYGMGLSKPAETPLHPTGFSSCLHHFSMSNYFWPIHWSIIYFLLYMNIQITAKPVSSLEL